jgi:hypothetical protein
LVLRNIPRPEPNMVEQVGVDSDSSSECTEADCMLCDDYHNIKGNNQAESKQCVDSIVDEQSSLVGIQGFESLEVSTPYVTIV